MPYMLLVMEPVGQREARPIPDGQVLYDRMLQFGENLKARGIGKVYDSLGPTSKGFRVEMRNGKRSMVDGPFAEAKEIVGGFFLLDCTKEASARGRDRMPGRRIRHDRGARSRSLLGAIARPRARENNSKNLRRAVDSANRRSS